MRSMSIISRWTFLPMLVWMAGAGCDQDATSPGAGSVVTTAPAETGYYAGGDKGPWATSLTGMRVALWPETGCRLLFVEHMGHLQEPSETYITILRLAQRFRSHSLTVVGICTDVNEGPVLVASTLWQVPWPLVMNDRTEEAPLTETLGVTETPAVLLLCAGRDDQILLDLSSEEALHEAVAAQLDVPLAEVPMPPKPELTPHVRLRY